jgi:hypothetical protein
MKLVSLIFLCCISFSAFSHESEEEIILKAANDALVIRVAELLAENQRLTEFLEKALVAESNNEPVMLGCDPQSLREMIVKASGNPTPRAKAWVEENQASCTAEQLTYMHRNIENWTIYTMGSVRILILFYRDNK